MHFDNDGRESAACAFKAGKEIMLVLKSSRRMTHHIISRDENDNININDLTLFCFLS